MSKRGRIFYVLGALFGAAHDLLGQRTPGVRDIPISAVSLTRVGWSPNAVLPNRVTPIVFRNGLYQTIGVDYRLINQQNGVVLEWIHDNPSSTDVVSILV